MNEITKQKILELPNNIQKSLIDIDIQWTKDGFNVNGSVNLSSLGLIKLPKFNIVNGNFYCYNNQLTSLQGTPKEIGGSFYCSDNKLTSLQYSPKEVGRDFNCSNNKLTSLQYAPKEINSDFWCIKNKLNSLQGLNKVGGKLYLTKNNLDAFTLLWVQKNYNVKFYE